MFRSAATANSLLATAWRLDNGAMLNGGGDVGILTESAYTAGGGYGYAIGAYLAYAYIKPGLNRVGNEFDVMVMGESRRAVIVEQCVYDPDNLLPRSED